MKYQLGKDINDILARLERIEQSLHGQHVIGVSRPRVDDDLSPLGCSSSDHSDPSTGTTVHIRRARDIFGGCYRSSADLHLGKAPAERIVHGTGEATKAIGAALIACGLGVAGVWVTVAGKLVGIGYDFLKNDDGSIDIYITTAQVRGGRERLPLAGAAEAIAILDSF